MTNTSIHKNFKLNGQKFSTISDLLAYTNKELPEAHEFFKEWFGSKKFLTVYTSGSTGKPKGIKLKKAFMINSALATARYFELEDEKITALLCMSPKYIAGKMMLVRALISGWHLDVITPTSHPLSGLKKYDFTAMVPLQLHNSLKELHKVNMIIVGGGAVSQPLQKKIMDLKTKIFSTYGMTETVTHIAVKKLNNLNGITNYFEVLPDIKIEKDDRNCLVINAPNLSEEKIITNDIIKLIDDKHFCWIGRFDNIINSGGVKINPERVEQKLEEVIKHRFFVASQKDEALGNKVILIVEDVKKSKIDNSIFKFLDKYEKPKTIFYIDKFIETKTGKIDRKANINLI
ncbi:MAG: AMP-binding protein [Flavobacteriaceae bacterium]